MPYVFFHGRQLNLVFKKRNLYHTTINTLVARIQSIFYSICRNPDEAVRPTFCEIVVSLQQPDFQILKWSSADEAKYSKAARTLGSPIEKGHGLHPELQRSYLGKGMHSADSSSNPLIGMGTGTGNIASSCEDSRMPDTRYENGYNVLPKSDDLSTCEGAGSEYDNVCDDGYDVLSKSDDVSIDM